MKLRLRKKPYQASDGQGLIWRKAREGQRKKSPPRAFLCSKLKKLKKRGWGGGTCFTHLVDGMEDEKGK